MKFLALLVLATPIMTFAQDVSQREILESRVLLSLKGARQEILSNLEAMTDRDLRNVERMLNDVRDTAMGQGPSLPLPRPVPLPVCSQESVEQFQQTFRVIKNFAYSSQGLDLDDQGATIYANNWANTYPCALATKFMADFKRVKVFAYTTAGLDLSAQDATSYAKVMTPRLCPHVTFEQSFSKLYNFAYSGSGLNMSVSDAKKYAQPRVEAEAFICKNF